MCKSINPWTILLLDQDKKMLSQRMMSLGSDGSTDVAAVGLEVLVSKVLRLAEGIHITCTSNEAKVTVSFFSSN